MIKRFLFLTLMLLALAVPASAQLGTVPNTFIEGVNIIDDLNENFSTAYANALNRTGGTMTGQFTSQAIVPATTATYDLGTTLVKFRDAFFSRNVDIAGTLNVDGAVSDSNSAFQVNDQMQVTSTTAAQFQIRYDSSNYLEYSISSAGAATVNAVGASAGVTFSDAVTVNAAFNASTYGAISSNGNFTLSSGSFVETGTSPFFQLTETDGSADAKKWRTIAASDGWNFQTMNDAEGVINNIMTVSRTGATVGTITFYSTIDSVGKIMLPAGLVGTPALTFSSDTDTGFYNSFANELSVTTGGTRIATFSSTSLEVTNDIILTDTLSIGAGGEIIIGTTFFASLGAGSNGTLVYCSDCTIANPCAAAGTGAFAKRLNNIWVCN
jgi:hypothetical protein